MPQKADKPKLSWYYLSHKVFWISIKSLTKVSRNCISLKEVYSTVWECVDYCFLHYIMFFQYIVMASNSTVGNITFWRNILYFLVHPKLKCSKIYVQHRIHKSIPHIIIQLYLPCQCLVKVQATMQLLAFSDTSPICRWPGTSQKIVNSF